MTKRLVAETATPRGASNPPKDAPGIYIYISRNRYIYIYIYIFQNIHYRIYMPEWCYGIYTYMYIYIFMYHRIYVISWNRCHGISATGHVLRRISDRIYITTPNRTKARIAEYYIADLGGFGLAWPDFDAW